MSRLNGDEAGPVVGSVVPSAAEVRDALAAQAERLELVLEGSGLGIWDLVLDSGGGFWDERCAAILGYSLDELQPVSVGKWVDLIHPDDLARAAPITVDYEAEINRSVDIEVRMRHGDGQWMWVRVRGKAVEWSAAGKPSRMMGTMEDTTQRVEARQAVERSESDLRAAQRLARLGSLTWDRETDRVSWSDELFELFGLDPANGAPNFADQQELYGAESWELLLAAVAETMNSGTPYEMDIEFVRPDSTRGWLRVRGAPVLDRDGMVVGLRGQAQDITAQRAALTESERGEHILRETQRMAHIGSWLWDPKSDRADWSAELFVLFGLDADEGAPDFADQERLYAPASWVTLNAAVAEALGTGAPFDLELEINRADLTRAWGRVRGEPYRDKSGGIVAFVGFVQDITEARKAKQALAESESLFRTAMLSSPIGLAMADLDGSFTVVNEALCRLLGHEEQWLLTHTEQDIILTEDATQSEFGPGLDIALKDDATSGLSLVRFLSADRRVLWVKRAVEVVAGSDGQPDYLLVQYADTTDQHDALEKLAFQAHHDMLTGLRNRPWIMDMLDGDLQRAKSSGANVAVLFIDLDHFKIVNDSLGHAAGDEVLVAVAGRIADVIRPHDRVGRSGGDEFIVVLPGVADVHEAELMGDEIVSAVAQELTIGGYRIVPSVSIGIGLNESDSTGDSLLRNADAALFRAKEAGRSRWQVFDNEMHAYALERLTIEEGIRAGLEADEFVVHYQPVVSLGSGRVVGHEALVRWQHPIRGLLSPAHFMATAEDSGLIVGIGESVVDQACMLLASRPDLPGPISLNVSPVQLARSGWRQSFTETLARHGVDPTRVVVEITETAVMSLSEAMLKDLALLRDLGTGIHVDDFGTGFSSISLLRDLPVTGLKLDASFVADLAENDESAHALSAGLARLVGGLKLMGVAEGVETVEQHEALTRHGWSHAQGYLYARPSAEPVLDVEKPGK